MHVLTALAAVLQFGIGLIVSGTTNPPKVLGVLDLAESWDPSLAIVMGGAILAAAPSFRFASKRERSLLGAFMRLPAATRIESPRPWWAASWPCATAAGATDPATPGRPTASLSPCERGAFSAGERPAPLGTRMQDHLGPAVVAFVEVLVGVGRLVQFQFMGPVATRWLLRQVR